MMSLNAASQVGNSDDASQIQCSYALIPTTGSQQFVTNGALCFEYSNGKQSFFAVLGRRQYESEASGVWEMTRCGPRLTLESGFCYLSGTFDRTDDVNELLAGSSSPEKISEIEKRYLWHIIRTRNFSAGAVGTTWIVEADGNSSYIYRLSPSSSSKVEFMSPDGKVVELDSTTTEQFALGTSSDVAYGPYITSRIRDRQVQWAKDVASKCECFTKFIHPNPTK